MRPLTGYSEIGPRTKLKWASLHCRVQPDLRDILVVLGVAGDEGQAVFQRGGGDDEVEGPLVDASASFSQVLSKAGAPPGDGGRKGENREGPQGGLGVSP